MPHHEENDFSAPAETHEFSALLFDMDGTIIDSTDAIIEYWHQLAKEIGVDGDEILKTSHGRRSIDVLRLLAPEKATWDYICQAEGLIPQKWGSSAVEIPGSRSLLARLESLKAPWAIVTSGTQPLVSGWLDVMKLSRPKVMVTAEEVALGKPDPACYRLGAERLGFGTLSEGEEILVLEDAPAGVMAGKAAGYKVLGLATTHTVEQLRDAGADWIVRNLESVSAVKVDAKTGKVEVEIRDALVR
ncbi:glycerol-3-phosphate phosphatase like protein [Zymoseptoria brevis]|uniref:Glycerol-3-phosphate phosphatase like protein n=1 Tax=Zymoseptoria brevis TaxID=1047168 RepID=A0A0F4GF22_9PEZI|nr:glycerol-3-phosphate phosphatase like protein [Zymoseptoria brevis]